jgi:malonate-semialdehyde dehydrogenase (acetylating)/methylmalonate-semialdehyde dehydrogenase
MRQVHHFIAGAHKAGSDTRTGDIFDPGTGQVQAQVCMGTPGDLDQAVQAALAAQPDWAATNPQRRAACYVPVQGTARSKYG